MTTSDILKEAVARATAEVATKALANVDGEPQ